MKPKVTPAHKAEEFRKLGAIVVDVMALLENLSRIERRDFAKTNNPTYYQEKLAKAKDAAMLVASHALAPVLEALNDECMQWKFDPERSV